MAPLANRHQYNSARPLLEGRAEQLRLLVNNDLELVAVALRGWRWCSDSHTANQPANL